MAGVRLKSSTVPVGGEKLRTGTGRKKNSWWAAGKISSLGFGNAEKPFSNRRFGNCTICIWKQTCRIQRLCILWLQHLSDCHWSGLMLDMCVHKILSCYRNMVLCSFGSITSRMSQWFGCCPMACIPSRRPSLQRSTVQHVNESSVDLRTSWIQSSGCCSSALSLTVHTLCVMRGGKAWISHGYFHFHLHAFVGLLVIAGWLKNMSCSQFRRCRCWV